MDKPINIRRREEKSVELENVSSDLPTPTVTTFSNVSAETLTTAMNDALEFIQDKSISSNSVNFSQYVDDDWIKRAETFDFNVNPSSINNLLNEAVENIRMNSLLTTTMDQYLAPEEEQSDSVALDPVDEEMWPVFDFSLFDLNPRNNVDDDDIH